jgi:hypothetical protein
MADREEEQNWLIVERLENWESDKNNGFSLAATSKVARKEKHRRIAARAKANLKRRMPLKSASARLGKNPVYWTLA